MWLEALTQDRQDIWGLEMVKIFLMEVDPSLVERKKKKKPLRRLNETVSGAWCRYHTTEIISVLKHQRALGCQALAS